MEETTQNTVNTSEYITNTPTHTHTHTHTPTHCKTHTHTHTHTHIKNPHIQTYTLQKNTKPPQHKLNNHSTRYPQMK